MIPEIGIMIGVFLLARLIPSRWKRAATVLSSFAFVVAFLVVIDLGLRGFVGYGVPALFSRSDSGVETVTADADSTLAKVSEVSVTEADGGSITTNLGYGIAVAKGSSLRREWIAIHDTALPVALHGTPGVKTVYVPAEYRGDYRYRSNFSVTPADTLQALEVHFLTFDVWGNHVKSLSYNEVSDMPKGKKTTVKAEWSLYSENEVEEHYASIAYVARVRLKNGQVLVADVTPAVRQALRFSDKFTAADLEPESPGQPGNK